jgi:serine/threonine protein kinase
MPADLEKARELFLHAVGKLPADEWEGYLAAACGKDAELQRQTERLLRVHREAGSFLVRPAPPLCDGEGALATGAAGEATAEQTRGEGPGTKIGPYKLLEEIGEGGFGIVFMAEQEQPVRRKVALKVLKPGMDTRQVVARFEAERQALALMDHPNIAHIFDGGATASGRPYFVMELVEGIPITEFCDQDQMTVRQRLELFLDICRAVQHAHQKGVIHRDLKPSNVLVTLHDGTPVVKVIDFGIAKALGQQLTDKTLFTNLAQLIGTPLYMSPEQAALSGLDMDTRSDIYSLGVLLYELLTGTAPFDQERLRTAAFDEVRRMIREEEPPKPSSRLGKDSRTTISRFRPSSLIPHPSSLRELDWIVMKCLEKDRNRRYESTSELAMDIQRYLAEEPLLACPPTAAYRLRKLARRHKRSLLTLGMVLTALVGGTVASVSQARRAARAQVLAQERLEAAEANLLLARQAVDEMYTQVADELVAHPHMQPYQRDILVKALRFYEQFAQRRPADVAIREQTASALLRVGQIQFALRERRQAKHVCQEALRALEELPAQLPTKRRWCEWLGDAYKLHGEILASEGWYQQAESRFRQALVRYGELVGAHPGDLEPRSHLAETHHALANVLAQSLRPQEAEQASREAIRLREELVAERHDHTAYRGSLICSYTMLGGFLNELDRPKDAERALQQSIRVVGEWGESVNRIKWGESAAEIELGRALAASGRPDAAENAYRRAIAAQQRLAAQFPDGRDFALTLADYWARLAAFLERGGKRDEAVVARRSARDLFEKLEAKLGNDSDSLVRLAEAGARLRTAGDLDAAERFVRNALTLAGELPEEEATLPYWRWLVAGCHGHLGNISQARGRWREAADQYRQVAMIHAGLAAEIPDEPLHSLHRASAVNFVGIALRNVPSEAATALQCHEQALGLCSKLVAEFPDRPRFRMELVRSHFALGVVLRLGGRPAEAVQALERALGASRPDCPQNRSQFGAVHNELAWLLSTDPDVNFRDPSRAVALARKAVELEPSDGGFWNTLGVTCYRAGDWNGAREALARSQALRHGGDSFDWFFLAMVDWRHGERDVARKRYQQAVDWMEKKRPKDQELVRFRSEAAALLGLPEAMAPAKQQVPPKQEVPHPAKG